MYICEYCRRSFDEPKVIVDNNYGADADGNRGIRMEEPVCPHCGDDDISDAVECSECGEPVSENDIVDGKCYDCNQEAV